MKKLCCLLISAMMVILLGTPVYAQEEQISYELSGLVYQVPADWAYERINDAQNLHASQDGKTTLKVTIVADYTGDFDAALDEIKAQILDADRIDLEMDGFRGVSLTGATSGNTWINAACIANDAGCLTFEYTYDGPEEPEGFKAILNHISAGEAPYIGNKNTDKFHYASCSSVDDMKDKNKVNLYSREAAIDGGYVPCKRCNP